MFETKSAKTKKKTYTIPLFDQGKNESLLDEYEIGDDLGYFCAYIQPSKSSTKGEMARFYAENGDNADRISELSKTKFVNQPVKVSVFLLKDKDGQIIRNEKGKAIHITSFLSRIIRPDPTDLGMTAKFMAENGKNSDAVTKLNLSEYKGAWVYVLLQMADNRTLIEEIETVVSDENIENESKNLTIKEKEILKAEQDIAKQGEQILDYNRFFNNPKVLAKIGNVEAFKLFLETQRCVFPNAEGDPISKENGIATKYVSRFPTNLYCYVPISEEFQERFKESQFEVVDPQDYLDDMNFFLLKRWAKNTLKERLQVPQDFYIPPTLLLSWAIKEGLANEIPMQYKHLA